MKLREDSDLSCTHVCFERTKEGLAAILRVLSVLCSVLSLCVYYMAGDVERLGRDHRSGLRPLAHL
jgi:hypothetical protein